MLLEFKSAGARFVLQWVFFSVFSSPPMHLVLFTTFIQLQAHTQVHSGLQMDDCTLFTRKIRVLEVQRYIRSVCLWTRLRVALSVQGKLLTVVLRVANNCTQAKVLLVCKSKYLSTRNNTHHKNKTTWQPQISCEPAILVPLLFLLWDRYTQSNTTFIYEIASYG